MRSLDVLEHTQRLGYAKFGTETSAKYGFTLFLVGQGSGDRISVGSDHAGRQMVAVLRLGQEAREAL